MSVPMPFPPRKQFMRGPFTVAVTPSRLVPAVPILALQLARTVQLAQAWARERMHPDADSRNDART